MKTAKVVLLLLSWVIGFTLAQSSTWEATPSRPTTPGAASNCNKWYTVKKGDTCSSVSHGFGISIENFLRWNPSVSTDCLTNFWVDTSYCVGVGPVVAPTGPPRTDIPTKTTSRSSVGPTTDSSYTFINPIPTWNVTTSSVDSSWPPTKTQEGQPKTCNNWYLVQPGDTCESIFSRYRSWMTFEQFLDWNPALKADCKAPWIGWWVCVGVQPTSTFTIIYPTETPPPPETWRPTSTSEDIPDVTSTPTQSGLAPNCQSFYKAVKGDTCERILSEAPLITKKELLEWNPALGPDCEGLVPGYYYCVAAYSGGWLPMPPTVTNAPSPTPSGITAKCTAWYQRIGADSCEDIANMFGTFSVAEFLEWNSGLTKDCVGLQDGYWYCVAVPGTPTTRTAPVALTPRPTTPLRQPGIVRTCNRWWTVGRGDTCSSIAEYYGIPLETFLAWNPSVSVNGHCDHLLLDYEVCVGVAESGSSSPVPSPSPTPRFPTPSTTPWITPPSSVPRTSPSRTFNSTQTSTISTTFTTPKASTSTRVPFPNSNCTTLIGLPTTSTWITRFPTRSTISFTFFPPTNGTYTLTTSNPTITLVPTGTSTKGPGTLDPPTSRPTSTAEYPGTTSRVSCTSTSTITRLTGSSGQGGSSTEESGIPCPTTPCTLTTVNQSTTSAQAPGTSISTITNLPTGPGEPGTSIIGHDTSTATTNIPTTVPGQSGTWTNGPGTSRSRTTDDLTGTSGHPTQSTVPGEQPSLTFATGNPTRITITGPLTSGISSKTSDAPCNGSDSCGASSTVSYTAGTPIVTTTVQLPPVTTTATVTLTETAPETKTITLFPPCNQSPVTTVTTVASCTDQQIITPSPVQPGMISGCQKFYRVKKGDACWTIARQFDIPMVDFIKWNPGVKPDCSSLWAGSYACVRISEPSATVST